MAQAPLEHRVPKPVLRRAQHVRLHPLVRLGQLSGAFGAEQQPRAQRGHGKQRRAMEYPLCWATHEIPPGSFSTARPLRSVGASAATRTGDHGGVKRAMAPERSCHAKTSASGAATTLECVNPIR